MSPGSKTELYWKSIETAPPDVALQVRVSDGASDYLLPYPCKLTPAGWVNAMTGSPLAVAAFEARARFSARSRLPMWRAPRQLRRTSSSWTKSGATASSRRS